MGAILGSLQLNGHMVTRDTLNELRRADIPGLSKQTVETIADFLATWWNDDDFITVRTSGSTGPPKDIHLSKKTISASADKTLDFFGLKPNQKALLCLPCRYIAGKLMLVRALRGELRLVAVEPEMNPLLELDEAVDFAALIPEQAKQALSHTKSTSRFESIDQILIGGGPIEPQLEAQLARCPNRIFHSYGMTETATHVALREIGRGDFLKGLKGVKFSTDERGCLVIESDRLPEQVVTNDLAELVDPHTFRWLGRVDHAIISGGVKHIPELLEEKVSDLIKAPFYFSGEPDGVLGEMIVLTIEGSVWTEDQQQTLLNEMESVLGSYEIPRKIRFKKQLERTPTGKIVRGK